MFTNKLMCLLTLVLLGGPAGLGCAAESRTTASKGKPAAIPFELYSDAMLVVKGSVGAIGDVNILLDTGASPSAISVEMAGRLHLNGHLEPVLSSGGALKAQIVTLPSVQIGPLQMISGRALVLDLSYLQRNYGVSIDAIAGLDVLSTGSFMLDFRRRKIVFELAGSGIRSVRFDTLRPFLTVKGRIAGREVRLLVDSGTPGLMLFRERLTSDWKNLDPLPTGRQNALLTMSGTMSAA